MFKKIVAATLALFLSGCSLLPKTATSFIDYYNVYVYGCNGHGYVDVVLKDYSVNDFSNDDEFIATKNVLSAIGNYVSGKSSNSSRLSISQTSGLSNGDVITIGVSAGGLFAGDLETSGTRLNLDDVEVKVAHLDDGFQFDMFDPTNVVFYCLPGVNEIFFEIPNTTSYSNELADNIEFDIDADDTSDISKDHTVFHVEADLSDDFLFPDTGEKYYNIDIYLAKHGLYAVTEADLVLKTEASAIDVNDDAKVLALTDRIYSQFDGVSSIVNLQKSDTDDFSYLIRYVDQNGKLCDISCKLANLNEKYIIVGGEYSVKSVSSDSAANGYTIVRTF